MSVFTPLVIENALDRCQGYCEACGGPLFEKPALHHRKSRRYGDHSLANIMVVHGGLRVNCHNLHQGSIHQNPDRSHRLGHILYEHEDPATVPFVTVPNLLELRT
jgi:hypothetical protein